VSAFDKLIHDIIRIGMVQIFVGERMPTKKYNSEPISIQFHFSLMNAEIPPREFLFEREIVRKLGYLSFQDPDKISEALALIWSENAKWAKISSAMGWTESDARTKLKLIAARRNAIVHEADRSPITNDLTAITLSECNEVTDFLQACGQAVTRLIV
jgi:hypothetical protein